MHDREQPGAKIGACLPQITLFPSPCERVLHQIVRTVRIAGENAGVTAQPRQGGDQFRLWEPGLGTRDEWRQEPKCLRRGGSTCASSVLVRAKRAGGNGTPRG